MVNNETLKTQLTKAFQTLRKQGFIARQNFSCCSGCAGYELTEMASDRKDKGVEVKGAVFYHRQDAEVFGSRSRSNFLMIRFSPLDSTKHGVIGLPQEVIGDAVVAALKEQGLSVRWNGLASECIKVQVR